MNVAFPQLKMHCNIHQGLQSKKQKKQLEEKLSRKSTAEMETGRRLSSIPGQLEKMELNATQNLFISASTSASTKDIQMYLVLPSFTEKAKKRQISIIKNEKKKLR